MHIREKLRICTRHVLILVLRRDRIRWWCSRAGRWIEVWIIWAIFRVYGWKWWCLGSHSSATDRLMQSASNRIYSTISFLSCHCICYTIHKLIFWIWVVIVFGEATLHGLFTLILRKNILDVDPQVIFVKFYYAFAPASTIYYSQS